MRKNIHMTRISITTCVFGLALVGGSVSVLAESTGALGTQGVAQDAARADLPLQIVKADKSFLRSGGQDIFYAIAELNANTPLQAIDTSGTYTQVLLPDFVGAFVSANEVEAASGGKTLTLIVDSKLLAPSHLSGLAGAWKTLYDAALPMGTTLKVLEVLKNDAGVVLGYRVIAPTSPSGELPVAYIRSDALRDATAEEISAFKAGTQLPSTKPSIKPAPKPAPKPDPIAEEATEPSARDQVDHSMMDEMDMPSSEPVEIENAAPIKVETALAPKGRTAPSGRVSASALEDLEAAFDSARTLPKAQLDDALDELYAEFTRTRAQAQEGSSLANALDQRIEWLDIRMESRDQRRAIAATLAAYDAKADQLAKDIQAWQDGRAYQLVGRMVTSAVYTGDRLPLLYRIQATDPATGAQRTVGYVAPNAEQDFRHLLGRVVGVIGKTNNDQSLKLIVIEPERIDPMPE